MKLKDQILLENIYGQMNQERVVDDMLNIGYQKGQYGTWESPVTGEVLSFEQARAEFKTVQELINAGFEWDEGHPGDFTSPDGQELDFTDAVAWLRGTE
jgi:hypothetical protein